MPILTGSITEVTGGALDPSRLRRAFVRAPGKRVSLATEGRLVSAAPVPVDVTGEISLELEPGPALLVIEPLDSSPDTYELYVTADMTLLSEAAAEAAPAHERSWAESVMVQLRAETVEAAGDAQAAKTDAEGAASTAEGHRTHVDSIRDLLDEAAQSNVAPYLTETALNATYGHEVGKTLYAPAAGLMDPLDIWDEFNADGDAVSWPARNYNDWIAGVETRLSGTNAIKEQIGTDRDGNAIWCWHAGAENAPHVLIVGGTHPSELLSQWAAMRFFTEFVDSDNPVMVALRKRVRISWVPTLTPDGYWLTRNGKNGVNGNRNFDYFWEYYDEPGDDKGPEPMSEPGSQAVKYLLDTYEIGCVFDCHMLGNTGAEFQYYFLTNATTTNQAFRYEAAHHWNATYNADKQVTWGITDAGSLNPTVASWSEWYMRFKKGRLAATAITLEARVDIAGSSGPIVTRTAMRAYCGSIHTFVALWAEKQPVPTPVPQFYRAQRVVEAAETPVQDGGTLLTAFANNPIHFDRLPAFSASEPRPFLDVAVPCPGYFEVTAQVGLMVDGTTYPRGVRLGLAQGPTPVGGGDVQVTSASQQQTRLEVPDSRADTRDTINVSHYYAYVGTPGDRPEMLRFQLVASLRGSGAEPVRITRALMMVRFWPAWKDTYTQPIRRET